MVKKFAGNPRVATAIISQVDSAFNLETFWSNLYLRGQMLYDPSANVGAALYNQPYGGVPFSRGWVIAPDQTVALPVFGYNPDLMTETIYALLAELGDLNGDGYVNSADLAELLGSWGPCAPETSCPADLNDDSAIDAADLALLLGNWG